MIGNRHDIKRFHYYEVLSEHKYFLSYLFPSQAYKYYLLRIESHLFPSLSLHSGGWKSEKRRSFDATLGETVASLASGLVRLVRHMATSSIPTK